MSHTDLVLPPGLTVLERNWLSANNILIAGLPGEGATLIDTGHLRHADQTLALVQHALGGEPLARIFNTHLHSDHCGGNARLQQATGCCIWTPPGQADAIVRWDTDALSYGPTGQRCERFAAQGVLIPEGELQIGAAVWEVMAAPGHDPDSVMFFQRDHGVLISADALWEHGFGVVFPELEGASAFRDVAAVLDLIERLPVRCVIPGHGRVFTDVAAALARARERLALFEQQPERHARHAAKVLIKFHLMEEGRLSLDALQHWLSHTPLLISSHERAGSAEPQADWARALLDELVASAHLLREGDWVIDP
jgi:glyoxylase-like metal-dependent hydrolase (beta-lactamase superfamily II)